MDILDSLSGLFCFVELLQVVDVMPRYLTRNRQNRHWGIAKQNTDAFKPPPATRILRQSLEVLHEAHYRKLSFLADDDCRLG